MFDFDAGKLLIIGVVALIVIGPKDLPRVLRQVGQAVGRIRRMAGEFQGQFMDAMKEADLQDIRNEMTKVTQAADLKTHFDPVRDVRNELTRAVAPPDSGASATVATEDLPSPGEGFTLPKPEPISASLPTAGESVASAGLAPVVPEAADEAFAFEAGETAGKKRKILLSSRRPAPVPARTARLGAEAGSRFRNVRPRRQEAVEP